MLVPVTHPGCVSSPHITGFSPFLSSQRIQSRGTDNLSRSLLYKQSIAELGVGCPKEGGGQPERSAYGVLKRLLGVFVRWVADSRGKVA